MEGAKAPESRPYWIRYIVAFWAIEKLKWAMDNVLIACLCSVTPGLIAAGLGPGLSHRERSLREAPMRAAIKPGATEQRHAIRTLSLAHLSFSIAQNATM